MPKLGLFSAGWSVGETVQFGASDFWRLAVPGRELARNGWSVVIAREIQAAHDGTMLLKDSQGVLHDDCEVVLWQRFMGEGAAAAIRRARSVGQVVVNDVDDYYWAMPNSNTSRRLLDPRNSPGYNRDIYQEVIRSSSLVTVSTPWLDQALRRWGPPTRVVRNYIALDKWDRRPPGKLYGWVGVVGWRGADLQILSRSVVPWLRDRGLPFYHGGDMNGGSDARDLIGYDRVVSRPAADLPGYARLWDPLRVALIPIEDSTFGRAKSWVKGLEACARGIPFVASDHQAYRDLGVGRRARRAWEWTAHLDALQDPEVYASESAANRERAENLSIDRNWRQWDVVLREALAGAT